MNAAIFAQKSAWGRESSKPGCVKKVCFVTNSFSMSSFFSVLDHLVWEGYGISFVFIQMVVSDLWNFSTLVKGKFNVVCHPSSFCCRTMNLNRWSSWYCFSTLCTWCTFCCHLLTCIVYCHCDPCRRGETKERSSWMEGKIRRDYWQAEAKREGTGRIRKAACRGSFEDEKINWYCSCCFTILY